MRSRGSSLHAKSLFILSISKLRKNKAIFKSWNPRSRFWTLNRRFSRRSHCQHWVRSHLSSTTQVLWIMAKMPRSCRIQWVSILNSIAYNNYRSLRAWKIWVSTNHTQRLKKPRKPFWMAKTKRSQTNLKKYRWLTISAFHKSPVAANSIIFGKVYILNNLWPRVRHKTWAKCSTIFWRTSTKRMIQQTQRQFRR